MIGGRAELLMQRLAADDPLRRHAEIIQAVVRQGAGLARQLLAFGRRQVLRPRVLDVNDVVREAEPLLRRLLGEDVELTVHLQAGPGRVLDRHRLVELDRAFADRHPDLAPGEHVALTVSDTGVGMSAEVQARAFEPSSPPSPPGRAPGSGSATVYGVIKQMDGHVTLENQVGRGTTVTVYLPLAPEAAPEPETAAVGTPPPGGTETILVVEDAPDVRELAVEILEGYGYRVLSAAGPTEALVLAERHASPIHLLLTDVAMPGMSGPELARHLTGANPHPRVLYMSGCTEHPTVQREVLELEVALLPKPFMFAELAGRVREALAG